MQLRFVLTTLYSVQLFAFQPRLGMVPNRRGSCLSLNVYGGLVRKSHREHLIRHQAHRCYNFVKTANVNPPGGIGRRSTAAIAAATAEDGGDYV